jgi:energy-coupling factor transport system permease protein
MNVTTPLAYRPRPGRLQWVAAPAAIAYLASFCVLAFTFSSPIILAGVGAGVAVAGLAAGAKSALGLAARWGVALGLLIVAVNGLVTQRGDTVLVRGGEVPVLGSLDVSLEALAAGGVLALRILVVMMAFAVYSASVDPDRVLRLVRPIAGRSALTASLIARMVPLASADHARLREAAALRGPGAAPAGRATLARRLLASSLDRAVDVAATLELRGYGLSPGRIGRAPGRRSRYERRFVLAGLTITAGGLAARLAGVGGFEAYPVLAADLDLQTLGMSVALPLVAATPFLGEGVLGGRRRPGRARVSEANGAASRMPATGRA